MPSDDWVDDFLEMTDEEQEAFFDIENFSASFWTVTSKSGIVPFEFTPAQKYIMRVVRRQLRTLGYVRINVLKCRQAGLTTWATRMLMWLAMRNKGTTALIVAHEQGLPEKWLRKCKQNYNQTPVAFRPEIVVDQAKQFVFDNESMFYIASVQGKFPAMGDTIHFAHFSECGKWDKPPISKNPDAVLGPLIPAIPTGANMRGTWIILESTGEMIGDWWFSRYEAGRRPEDEFENVFIPWFMCKEYSRPDLITGVIVYTPYELALQVEAEKYGIDLTDAQLMWRRNESDQAIYRAAPNRFLAEFPSYVNEAFMSAGGLQYTEEMRDKAAKTVRTPIKTQKIYIPGEPKDAEFINHGDGELTVWRDPERGREYAIGADCMWGDKDTADYDVAHVQDLDSGKCVAKIKGHFTQVAWADRLAAVGHLYNIAWLAPERNNQSAHGVMPRLLGEHDVKLKYPKMWRRGESNKSTDYGWLTDARSKGDLVTFSQGMTLSDDFDWCDKEAAYQMGMIVMDSNNKIGAPKGQHDDDWMSRMITAMVCHKIRPIRKKGVDTSERIGYHSMDWFDEQEKTKQRKSQNNLSVRAQNGY